MCRGVVVVVFVWVVVGVHGIRYETARLCSRLVVVRWAGDSCVSFAPLSVCVAVRPGVLVFLWPPVCMFSGGPQCVSVPVTPSVLVFLLPPVC